MFENAKRSETELEIMTYAVDVADAPALKKILEEIEVKVGVPEVVVYNASRLRQTFFGKTEAESLVEDFNVAITGLYVTATWAMPRLASLSQSLHSHPSFLITGGSLHRNPMPAYFALAMCKAAQVNLAKSLAKEYGPRGVHVATVSVGGHVTPESDVFNPKKIAEEYWRLYEQDRDRWEEIVHIESGGLERVRAERKS